VTHFIYANEHTVTPYTLPTICRSILHTVV